MKLPPGSTGFTLSPFTRSFIIIIIIIIKRGRQVGDSGIDLPDNQHIKEVEEDDYKYLGIMQLDKILNTKMKGKITSEYVKRVKKLCRSKLNGGNLISGINTWAVSVLRYSAGIVDWTVEELVSMDRRTRKSLAMTGCMHTRSNVARLYLPRKEGGRGLISIEEFVVEESKSLHGYLGETIEWMLQAALNGKVLDKEENLQDYKKRRQEETNRDWKEKALCRLCGDCSETVKHIVSGCKSLPRGNIGSAMIRWQCGCTGRFAESTA